MRRGRRWWGCVSLGALVLLYAPIVTVVVHSFNASRHGGPWTGFTWEWYRRLFDSPEKWSALINTLVVAGASTAVSTVLGTALGYALARCRFPGRRWVEWLIYLPVVIPDVVMAIALLMAFAVLRGWWGVPALGLGTMILGHITFQIPFVALVVRSRMSGWDPSVEEAAHDLGASPWQKLRHVTLPLAWPGVLAGAALAFTLSVDDFVVSFFTSGPGSTTLPILIYASVKRGVTPEINALSTLMVVVSVVGTLLISRFREGRGKGAGAVG